MGEPLRVSMEDIVDSLDPTESASILNLASPSSGARRIEQKISDPALDAMVIPIAVGGGSESAASNPKPVVTTGHDTVETRFDVFTYNAVSGGTANAQQKVETSVVACSCSTATPLPAATVRGYRPTYWDGSRYAPPSIVDTTGASSYSPKAKPDTSATQSNLCTACCRDHYDQIGVKGPSFMPKVATKDVNDAITATTHAHFLANSTGTAWTALTVGGKYSEACRLIRVDGFWRVAADMNNDHFKLLATKDLSNPAYYASGSFPDSTATTNYQGFVVDYLDARFTNNTDPTTYNTSPSVTTLETTRNLGLPASITLPTNFTGVVVTKTITAITKANPAVVTATGHTFANGDRVTVSGVGGMTVLNGNSYIIGNVTANTFELVGADSSAYAIYTGGGSAVVNHGKWLHARGLYVDYLEKAAIDAVANAKTVCPYAPNTSGYSDCVLKVLPFTSINLTEIADWNSSDTTKAAVTTNDYSDSSTKPDPVRGKVSIVSGAADAAIVTVSSLDRKSNTGLLDLTTNAISSTDNIQWNTSPSQVFAIYNPGPPPAAPDTFYAVLSIAAKSGLGVNYKTGAAASQPCSGFNAVKANYPCQVLNQSLPSAGLGVANSMAVEVVGYNSSTANASVVIPNNTSCSGPFGAKTYNPSTGYGGATTYIPNTCTVYGQPTAVDSTTTLSPSLTTQTGAGTQAAKTLFNFALIAGDVNTADTLYTDLITVTFAAPSSSAATLACTYTCASPGTCATSSKTIIAATAACP